MKFKNLEYDITLVKRRSFLEEVVHCLIINEYFLIIVKTMFKIHVSFLFASEVGYLPFLWAPFVYLAIN